MEPDIAKLIDQIKKRKSYALELVMDQYLDNVYLLAKKILFSIAPEEDIEECVQDTFLDAWNYIDKYNPDRGSFKTWLLILCKYRALNIRKKYQKEPELVELFEHQATHNETPENGYLVKEGSKEIINIINNFSPIDREIFIRRFILKQGIEEISNIMQLSRQSIDNRLWRGRTRLKEKLVSEGRDIAHD